MRRYLRRLTAFAAVFGLIASSAVRGRAQEILTLDAVLDRLHAYLADYANRLPATIASEHYVQRAGSGLTSTMSVLDSDFGIVRLPGMNQWLGFRDVLRANGKEVGDRGRRLDALFLNPPGDRAHQALLIAQESARQNIGPVARTINNPALVLEMFDGRNAWRMRFDKGREEAVGSLKAWVVRFTELVRPTIVSGGGNADAPATGRAWIDPISGTLLRAEVVVSTPSAGSGSVSCTTTVVFERDTKLGFWVPARMDEEYLNSRMARVSSGQATYTNYRQFAVDTNESLSPAP